MIIGKRKKRRLRIKNEFGLNPEQCIGMGSCRDRFDEISIYWNEVKGGKSQEVIDENTWRDMEMDEIFLRINHTRSFVGEQILFARLHEISAGHLNEKQLQFFVSEEKLRINLEERLMGIGKMRDDYYLPMVLCNPEICRMRYGIIYHILQALLLLFLFADIVSQNAFFIIMTMIIGIVNLYVYLFTKNKYEALMFSLGSVRQIILFCDRAVAERKLSETFPTEELEESLKEVKKLLYLIGSFQVRRNYYFMGDLGGTLLDYLMGITLYDVSMFHHVIKLLNGRQEDILRLYEFAGEIDMAISIASYRKSLPCWCVPDFSECKKIVAMNIAHPLVAEPIRNDILIDNNIILTGANASGKSTFMKALAINVILAETINTAIATLFSIPPKLLVMSSVTFKDDIVTGESYYIREINQMKKMIGVLRDDMPVLFVIDEIFKGTNSRERVVASQAVLWYLNRVNAFVVVATHDTELAELLKDMYQCYYFNSDIKNGTVLFDYKLHRGINSKTNAIALLKLMEFPAEIIYMAEDNLRG